MNVTYLFDPLCGWCYGAGPALERISEIEGISVGLAPTGLFAGTGARAMDVQFAAYAWQNDQRIARLTGQKFSEDYRRQVLGANGSMFDSAPATLAIVAVGLEEPSKELPALKALQHARYVDGHNNSHLDVVADILAANGFAEAAERLRAPDEDLITAYRQRLAASRALMGEFRINGVPALVSGQGSDRRLLPTSALYGSFDALASELTAA